jgi:hypothetical protein
MLLLHLFQIKMFSLASNPAVYEFEHKMNVMKRGDINLPPPQKDIRSVCLIDYLLDKYINFSD